MDLLISFDDMLEHSLVLMVSSHNFRRVSIWCVLLGLGVHRCWWGCGVLQPCGQGCLRPFLARVHQLPHSRAY